LGLSCPPKCSMGAGMEIRFHGKGRETFVHARIRYYVASLQRGGHFRMAEHTQQKEPDPRKIADLTQQVVKILAGEESESRHRIVQAALTLLGESPLAASKPVERVGARDGEIADHGDFAGFFNRGENLKPSDNAFLCAAYHYSQYGPVQFSVKELKAIASEAGLVVPNRVDVTFRTAGKGGKKFFQMVGRGSFKPTTSAALFFKEKWNLKPGKKVKSVGEAE
jgi:hypothetical protein